ncbi:NAD-dependent epimerase/dehydratase family protein [Paracoccus benzoatiresistens]|uniref:NAD(P)-dependent oxidoreductase n=1 Tax=Paracoccus benzoatiresistens TaxID=2997341 RepID=A0ABT4J169_9RHOB|nr:NAD(P)-dependent oxidoreductase [Paracoccus sp. EF6]MCZ0960639.1 NAD(P)-dependent oxidoreductase [Paracoccus sp. EF6]
MAEVLVTGGTGFIGSHLVRACIARGDRVTVLTRPDSDAWRLAGLDGRLALLRLPPECFARAARDLAPALVFHLAARTRFRDPGSPAALAQAIRQNLDPLVAMVTALADAPPRAFVRAGTLAEFGLAPAPYRDDVPERPAGAYGLSALMGTQYLRTVRALTGLPAVTARLSLTYGPGQSPDFLVPRLVKAAMTGQPETLAHPAAERSLLHVDDVVSALLAIGYHAARMPPVVTVSDPRPLTMADLAAEIAALGRGPVARIGDPSAGAADRVVAAPSAALTGLGWMPRTDRRLALRSLLEHEEDRLCLSRGAE